MMLEHVTCFWPWFVWWFTKIWTLDYPVNTMTIFFGYKMLQDFQSKSFCFKTRIRADTLHDENPTRTLKPTPNPTVET